MPLLSHLLLRPPHPPSPLARQHRSPTPPPPPPLLPLLSFTALPAPALAPQHGYNSGVPIDMPFFHEHISGRDSRDIMRFLFPGAEPRWCADFLEEKERRLRALVPTALQPVMGLTKFLAWVRAQGLRTAVVTNAPRDVCVPCRRLTRERQKWGGVGGNLRNRG